MTDQDPAQRPDVAALLSQIETRLASIEARLAAYPSAEVVQQAITDVFLTYGMVGGLADVYKNDVTAELSALHDAVRRTLRRGGEGEG